MENEILQEHDEESTPFGKYALLIDTDSCSVEIGPICKKILGEIPKGEWEDSQVTKVCEYVDNVLTKNLNEHCKKICKEVFLSDYCTIEFKREKCAGVGFFLQKKNYSVLVYDSEGVRQRKWSHTGNVLKKSSTPKKLKEKMKYIVEYAGINDWTQAQFSEYCFNLYEEFKTWDLLDFCKSCGYSTEKKFASPFNTKGVSSSTAIAANLYNDMLKFLKIEDRQKRIEVGDRFRVVYVKPNNQWGFNYIGFVDKFPREFYNYLEIDYKTNFEKYFIKPLEHYLKISGWRPPEVSKPALFDIDNL